MKHHGIAGYFITPGEMIALDLLWTGDISKDAKTLIVTAIIVGVFNLFAFTMLSISSRVLNARSKPVQLMLKFADENRWSFLFSSVLLMQYEPLRYLLTRWIGDNTLCTMTSFVTVPVVDGLLAILYYSLKEPTKSKDLS